MSDLTERRQLLIDVLVKHGVMFAPTGVDALIESALLAADTEPSGPWSVQETLTLSRGWRVTHGKSFIPMRFTEAEARAVANALNRAAARAPQGTRGEGV